MSNDSLKIDEKELWDSVLNQTMLPEDIVLQFLIGRLDLDYLSVNYSNDLQQKCIANLIKVLLDTTIPRIRELLSSVSLPNEVSAANIPQYSSFATAAIYLPELLLSSQAQFTNLEMGYLLFSETRSDGAAYKYGQNHGGLAIQLGLASITKTNQKNVYCPTPLTAPYCELEYILKMDLLQKLCFRIPIIQVAATSKTPIDTIDECLQRNLAKSTCLRRRPNVIEVLTFALGE